MNRAEYQRAWRAKNPKKMEAYNERAKARQKKNRAFISRREKEYRKNLPKGKRLEWDRRYRAKLRKERPWVLTYYNIRARVQNPRLWYVKNGVKCHITKNELKELWFRDKAWLLKRPSIDRINTPGHYTKDNCRYIELSENNNREKNRKEV